MILPGPLKARCMISCSNTFLAILGNPGKFPQWLEKWSMIITPWITIANHQTKIISIVYFIGHSIVHSTYISYLSVTDLYCQILSVYNRSWNFSISGSFLESLRFPDILANNCILKEIQIRSLPMIKIIFWQDNSHSTRNFPLSQQDQGTCLNKTKEPGKCPTMWYTLAMILPSPPKARCMITWSQVILGHIPMTWNRSTKIILSNVHRT